MRSAFAFMIAMCLASNISPQKCAGRAGIEKIYHTDCEKVMDVIIDPTTEEVTGIVMDATATDPVFFCIEFEENTAFLNQTKTRVKSGTNVNQVVSFNEPVMNPVTRKALCDLNKCCCSVNIVKDNTGQFHFTGINYFSETQSWSFANMKTGDGSGNTGADPTADANEYIETLTANVNCYAPFWTAGEAAIPV